MEESEIRELLIEWVQEYCGIEEIEEEESDLPPGMRLFLEKATEFIDQGPVKQESLADYSITYLSPENRVGFPTHLVTFLTPYRRVRTPK